MKHVPIRRPYGGQARYYDQEYRNYTDDIVFYHERLCAERIRSGTLEVGCGTGRVTIPLAQQGHRMTGIDLSRPMLRRAWDRRHAQTPEVAARIRFSLKDMRNFAYHERFGAVLIPFSTLAMIVSPAERALVVERCHTHLTPGGVLLIDLFAPRAPHECTPATRPQRLRTEFRLWPQGHIVTRETEERQDETGHIDHVLYRYELRSAVSGRVLDALDVAFSLARIGRSEIEAALFEAGFDVEAIYGDYRGGAFRDRSERMIIQARRL